VLGLLWAAFLSLGYSGISKYLASIEINASPLDVIYQTIQLVGMGSMDLFTPIPIEIEIARFALPTLAGITAITTITAVFFERMQFLRLRFIRDHVIICGLGQKGALLARSFAEQGYSVVIIDPDDKNPQLRQLQGRGVLTVAGSATNPDTLLRAGLNRATTLLAVCGDDRINAEIAMHAKRAIRPRKRKKPLHCMIHIIDPQLYEFLISAEIASQDRSSVRLEPFNVYDRGAKLLLHEHPPDASGDDPKGPSLLILGLDSFGQSLLIHAARSWIMQQTEPASRLKITVVDRNAEEICEVLSIRYPQLPVRCEIVPLSIEFDSPAFHRAGYIDLEDGDAGVDIIYVCLDDDSHGLSVVQSLLRFLPASDIPIVIRTRRKSSLVGFLRHSAPAASALHNIHTFSLLDETFTPDLLINGSHEMLARSLHEEYLRQVERAGEPESEATQSWSKLPERLRESNRKQVDRIASHLNAVGCIVIPMLDWDIPAFSFTREEIEQIARLEHDGWCGDLRKDGWTYDPGPRDPDRKRHPSLMDWDDLPETEREKNRTPVHMLPGVLARAGFRIDRVNSANTPDQVR
jgi:hypothetical protein